MFFTDARTSTVGTNCAFRGLVKFSGDSVYQKEPKAEEQF